MKDVDEMPTMNVIHLLALNDNEIFDLRKALGWYADEQNWLEDAVGFTDLSVAEFDSGKRAIEALKGNQ